MNETIQLNDADRTELEKVRKLNEESLAKQAEVLKLAEQVRQDKKAKGIVVTSSSGTNTESSNDFKLTPAMKHDKWLMEHGMSPKKY